MKERFDLTKPTVTIKGEFMSENQTTETQSELVIKKYQNRKFYDTESSHYVTLSEIHAAVKNGRVVRVIDNVTKKDITNKTLLMSLVETEGEREDLSTADVMALVKKGLSSK